MKIATSSRTRRRASDIAAAPGAPVGAVVDPRRSGAADLLEHLFGPGSGARKALAAIPPAVRGPLLLAVGQSQRGMHGGVVMSSASVLADAVDDVVALGDEIGGVAHWRVLADEATTVLVTRALFARTGLEVLP